MDNISSIYPKYLWMYWEQGLENLTIDYNRKCIDNWHKLNPDWNINVLDAKTCLNYVPEMNLYQHCSIQQRSDILRILLLEKYGGVWADASALPMKRLTGNIDTIDNGTNVFFYRYFSPRDKYYISSWFIIAKIPHHYLIRKLAEVFTKKMLIPKKMPYFIFHDTLTELYHENKKIRFYIDKLTISQDLSHAPLKNQYYPKVDILYEKEHPLMYKRAIKMDDKQYNRYIKQYLLKYNI